jgi:WD40 repeat protein
MGPAIAFEHGGWVVAGAVSADSRRVATAGSDGCVRVWDRASGDLVRTLHTTSPALALTFSPDGARLTAGDSDGVVREWGLANGAHAEQRHCGPVSQVTFSPDGRWSLSSGADGTATICDTATRSVLRRLVHPSAVRGAVFATAPDRVLTACADGIVRTWDVETVVHAFDAQQPVRAVAPILDGHGLVTLTTSASAIVVPYCSGTTRWLDVTDNLPPVWATTVSDDGSRIAIGTEDGVARVYDLDGDLHAQVRHGGPIRALRFSPRRDVLCTGGTDGRALVWPIEARS